MVRPTFIMKVKCCYESVVCLELMFMTYERDKIKVSIHAGALNVLTHVLMCSVLGEIRCNHKDL